MALIPPLLLALFACWSGTFAASGSWPAGPAGQAFLLAAGLLGAASWADPLRLGRSGRWLGWALLAAIAGSWAASPVPRAGRVGAVLLPLVLLLPGAIAACWRDRARRDLGLPLWTLVVAGVAAWSLVAQLQQGTPRAAMPLGHHNLLAAWLVVALPPAALLLRSAGWRRWLGAGSVLLASAALLACRSLAGGLAFAALAGAAAWTLPRARRLLLGLVLIGLGLLVPRIERILSGEDASVAARTIYWRAGWNGWLERPMTGWGPGATPWTLALHLEPAPGVSPPGEVVGELHSLYLSLLYETGAPATLLGLATVGLFALRRWRNRSRAADPGAVAAGLAALGAAGIAAGGAAFLTVPAIPIALAGAAGLALAGERGPEPRAPTRVARAWPAWLYIATAGVVLAPLALAERSYDAAVERPQGSPAEPLLARALALDPEFPLYQARHAWSSGGPVEQRAEEAISAARSAVGVAALWYRAGALAREAGRDDWRKEALRRAMALDPLSGFAPFQLFELSGNLDCAARALAAEPRLAAATLWRDLPELRAVALDRLAVWPGLDAGWRRDVVAAARAAPPGGGGEVDLAAQMDLTPALAVSLHQFRRRPWPADLARIRVERGAVRALRGLPAAAELPTSLPEAFPRSGCAPPRGAAGSAEDGG